MYRRATSWMAWALAALCAAMFLANVALYLATLPVLPPISWGTGGASVLLYGMVPFLPFPFVGAIIASIRPSNPIGWICLAIGILWMLNLLAGSYAAYGLRVAAPGSVPYPAAVGSLAEWLGPTTVLLSGTYLILLFPDGRLPSRRWRPVAWLCGAVLASNVVVTTLAPGHLSDLRDVSNPFGLEEQPWLAIIALEAVGLLFPVCMLASASSLLVRYLHSGKEVREQIRWLAFAASVVVLGISSMVVIGTFFASEGADPLLARVLQDAITISFAGIPVAIGFAVLKYRLYDIEIVINRTLVYVPLTATLVALYFGAIVVLQRLFVLLTEEKTTLAVVASTLVIAALFNPLRRRIQAFIDRRFYRSKYDARKTLEAFSVKLRDETNLQALEEDLVGVVRETMQPAYVSLWLHPDTTSESERAR